MDMEKILEQAQTGDSKAMGILGENYFHGNMGLDTDYELAYKWSKKASDLGNVRSKTVLGIMYLEGKYVDKDLKLAYELFMEASDKGDMKAPRFVAMMYRNGQQKADDPDAAAFEWFKKGADRGDITSRFYLGEMYENGLGTEKNMEEAVKWYRLSAERGDKIAQPGMDALKRLGIE